MGEEATDDNKDAATLALDEIARICGVLHWDYPDQLVRDVEALRLVRDSHGEILDALTAVVGAGWWHGVRDRLTPALRSVLEERHRQDETWGEQNHNPFTWLAILAEEVGELAESALDVRFKAPSEIEAAHMREEAVQVAAVALAIVECLDRGKWEFGW